MGAQPERQGKVGVTCISTGSCLSQISSTRTLGFHQTMGGVQRTIRHEYGDGRARESDRKRHEVEEAWKEENEDTTPSNLCSMVGD